MQELNPGITVVRTCIRGRDGPAVNSPVAGLYSGHGRCSFLVAGIPRHLYVFQLGRQSVVKDTGIFVLDALSQFDVLVL